MNNKYKASVRQIVLQASQLIADGKRKFKAAVMVIAPIFTQENSGEGYMQRVKAIDEEILFQTYNVYVNLETENMEPTLTVVDERHICITFNPHSGTYAGALLKLARKCGVVYTHSVMRAMEDIVGSDIRRLYLAKGIYKIWDVHGCVPEEFALADNYYEAQNAGAAEELFISVCDIIITVNNAMRVHLEKKYGITLQNAVVLPIFNRVQIDTAQVLNNKYTIDKPIAVYAGGLQHWQNIKLMQDTVEKAGDKYQYRIFVSKPDEYKSLWGKRIAPAQCTVEYKAPNKLLHEYAACRYGFVLRDDITVNNVACPTKLIEYLQFGIVPIYKTDNIGDFSELGTKYLTYEAFAADVQSDDEYFAMVNENFKVLQRLVSAHEAGKQALLGKLEIIFKEV